MRRQLQPHVLPQRACVGERVPGDERVVLGVEDEEGHLDARQELLAAAPLVVVLRVLEAVKGRGEDLVEGLDAAHPIQRPNA